MDELWTVQDVASYLRKPASWVYDNHKRYFRAARAGRALLFSPEEIKEWVRGRMRP
ncbi:helix-turn-helix domain-containing protein [Nocardiopsis sp. CNT-189]|uniref:helix-turn-helix domain-containing protein n=1 Tax=Nocardiopsis oceanisediminis TaxID=2816862 RepID=UPI003B32A4EB